MWSCFVICCCVYFFVVLSSVVVFSLLSLRFAPTGHRIFKKFKVTPVCFLTLMHSASADSCERVLWLLALLTSSCRSERHSELMHCTLVLLLTAVIISPSGGSILCSALDTNADWRKMTCTRCSKRTSQRTWDRNCRGRAAFITIL